MRRDFRRKWLRWHVAQSGAVNLSDEKQFDAPCLASLTQLLKYLAVRAVDAGGITQGPTRTTYTRLHSHNQYSTSLRTRSAPIAVRLCVGCVPRRGCVLERPRSPCRVSDVTLLTSLSDSAYILLPERHGPHLQLSSKSCGRILWREVSFEPRRFVRVGRR